MLYLQTMGEAFSDLFWEMSAVMFIVIVTGMMLVILEFYHSSGKVLGVLGGVLIAAGILMRIFAGGSALTVFLILFFVAAVLFTVHVFILSTQKKEWLKCAYDILVSKNSKSYDGRFNYLLNMTGIALTNIDSEGNISINEVNFPAYSEARIEQGSFVRVIKTDGEKLMVELFEPENEI